MKAAAPLLLTLVAAGCAGGYELWDYYFFSPWTRDARVEADTVGIDPAGYPGLSTTSGSRTTSSFTRAMSF